MLNPLGGAQSRITSPWGYRQHPIKKKRSFHNGVDMGVAHGTPVISPLPGKVLYVLDNDICGLGLVLQHDDDTRTGYCHLSRIEVKKGQSVKAGQQIGLTGGTKGTRGAGRSTGPHLHFIVYRKVGSVPWGAEDENTLRGRSKDWTTVDPLPYLTGATPDMNPFNLAKEWWDWWWEAPSIDPAAEMETATKQRTPVRPPTARQVPKTSSWTLGDTAGRQMRLSGQRTGAIGPGQIPSGEYSVEVFDGSRWVQTGIVTVRPGRRYTLSVVGNRIEFLER